MSELKAFDIVVAEEGCYEGVVKYRRSVYLKSEADKVVAELEESHKKEVEQLLIEIEELKKEKEYTLEHTTEVINAQEREILHQKYKRCLAMALWCLREYLNCYKYKITYWLKWRKRWLKLAEKFKEAK